MNRGRRDLLAYGGRLALAPLAATLSACGGGGAPAAPAAAVASAPAAAASSPAPAAAGVLRMGRAIVAGNAYAIVHSLPDGSDLKTVRSFPGVAVSTPRWSPDGRRIAYFSSDGGSFADGHAVWVMDADGGNNRLVGYGSLGSAAWHGDARHLAICPLGRGFGTFEGTPDVELYSGHVQVIDTDTGRVDFGRTASSVSPAVLADHSIPSGYVFGVAFDGDRLVYHHVDRTVYRGRLLSAPEVQPPVYEVLVRSTLTMSAMNASFPGTYGQVATGGLVGMASGTRMLAMNPRSGAMMLWETGTRSDAWSSRLVLRVSSSEHLLLAQDPVVRDTSSLLGPVPFTWTPDGTQCAYDGNLYDAADFAARGPGGATVLRSRLPAGDLAFFLG